MIVNSRPLENLTGSVTDGHWESNLVMAHPVLEVVKQFSSSGAQPSSDAFELEVAYYFSHCFTKSEGVACYTSSKVLVNQLINIPVLSLRRSPQKVG